MRVKQKGEGEFVVFTTLVVIVGLIVSLFWMWPRYNLYRARISGQAQLAESIAAKQVQVQDALAKKESAQSLAEAEIIRAGGVAKANLIIGDSLKGNDAYLHYLWVNALEHTQNQIVYIPTEAGIPITESRRTPMAGKPNTTD